MNITETQLRQIIREVLLERKSKRNSKKKKPVQHKQYHGSEYSASSGSVASIKNHGDSVKKAVKSGEFDWADDPYAAAQAAHIVATGYPTVKKGTKRKKK